MRRFRFLISYAVFSACLALSLSGCGRSSEEASFDPESLLGPSCGVSTDQRHSFMAKVPGFPIELRVDSRFPGWQRAGIALAAERWNELGKKLIGTDFFAIRAWNPASALRSATPLDCKSGESSPRVLNIVQTASPEARAQAASGTKVVVPALTSRCYGSDGVVRTQVVQIFANAIPNDQQFVSVALHELGHSLGLDHSCQSDEDWKRGPDSKFGACQGLSEDHPYSVAVMYPALRMGRRGDPAPETKESLAPNDILRTECLYGR